MSNQVYANPTTPFWLSAYGIDSISFNKLTSPPLAFLDKGILYELDDGKLYWNGSSLSPSPLGDVTNIAVAPVPIGSICTYAAVDGNTIIDTSVQIQGDIITGADGLILTTQGSAPDPSALWVKTSNNHLYHGAVDIEASNGDVNGPALSVADAVATYSDTTGKLIKNTTLLFTPSALQLPSSCDLAFWDGFSERAFLTVSPTSTNNIMAGFYSNKGSGAENVGLGNYCFGNAAFSGSANTAFGHSALNAVTTGSSNVCVGDLSGASLTTGFSNTCLGTNSLNLLVGGDHNIAIGSAAGSVLTTGARNIYLGNTAAGSGGAEDDTMRLGHSTTALTYIAGIADPLAVGSSLIYIDADGLCSSVPVPTHASAIYNNYGAPYSRTCTVNVPVEAVIPFSSSSLGAGWSLAAGRLTWGGAEAIRISVNSTYSMQCSAGTNVSILTELRISGVSGVTGIRRTLVNTTNWDGISGSGLLTLLPGQYISTWVTNLTNSTSVVYGAYNLSAVSIIS